MRGIDVQRMQREQAFVTKPGYRSLERWKRLRRKCQSCVPVWLVEDGPAKSFSLPPIKVETDWRILAGRTTDGSVSVVQRDQQQG